MPTPVSPVDFDSSINGAIARRIRALRTGLSITASTMDRECGFGVGTTGRLERAEQRVYVNHLFQICQVTGVRLEYFYGENTDARTAQGPEEQRFLETYLRISNPVTKRNVFELVETMAQQYDKPDAT